jgi:hypothetical protein
MGAPFPLRPESRLGIEASCVRARVQAQLPLKSTTKARESVTISELFISFNYPGTQVVGYLGYKVPDGIYVKRIGVEDPPGT